MAADDRDERKAGVTQAEAAEPESGTPATRTTRPVQSRRPKTAPTIHRASTGRGQSDGRQLCGW